jgi:hypothetical protein
MNIRKLFPLLGGGISLAGGIFRDVFQSTLAAGSVNGSQAQPGPGVRNITDVEANIITDRSRVWGFYQPTSAVWGESKLVYTNGGTGWSRAIGRTLVALYTSMDGLTAQAFGWDTATDTTDPRTVGHGWLTESQGGKGGCLDAIEPGATVELNIGGYQIRSSQYLLVVALNDVGAYTLISTFGNDTGDGIALPTGDVIGIPQYPLARVLWPSLTGTTTPLFPYISGYDAESGGYAPGHAWEDLRVIDVPSWITPDYLAGYADRCDRADSNTSIGTGWTNGAGVFGISSNQVYCVSGTNAEVALHDSGLTGDGIWQCDIVVPGDWNGSNYNFGMAIRAIDASNYIRVWNNGGDTIFVQVIEGGAFHATIVSSGYTFTAGSTYRLTVITYGAQYYILVNGINFSQVWTVDAGDHNLTGSGFGPYGFNANGKTTRWDNFVATPNTITLPSVFGLGAIPSVWTAGATLASDTFTDANTTRLNAHSAEAGGAWTEVNGTWTIASNKATVTGGARQIALQNVGVNDYECSVVITNPNPLGDYVFAGIIARYSDANNYIMIREADDVVNQANNHEIEVWVRVAGSDTLSSKTTMLAAFPAGGSRTLSVRVKGKLLEVFLDGLPRVCRILPDALASGTSCGLYRESTDGGAIFDTWTVKAL